jgi:hypothetical protein
MTEDGNAVQAGHQNGNKIRAKRAGAPRNDSRKKYYDIYREIITSLLIHEARWIGELAGDCGYKGSEKESSVRRQIKRLFEDRRVLERVPGDESRYRIKRDLDLIRRMYEDKTFLAIRPVFGQSPWLLQLIVQKHLPEFSGDADLVEDLGKMMGTSSMMMIFFLRNSEDPGISLGLLGPSLPVAKMSGPPMPFLGPLTRKCIIYDLFASCMCLEFSGGLAGPDLPDTSRQVFDEMKAKSVALKLKTIRRIQSFTLLQTASQCAEETRCINGQVHPLFDEIEDRFNKIVKRLVRDVEDPEPVEAVLQEFDELAEETKNELGSVSVIDPLTGRVDSIGPLSDTVLKNRLDR